GQQLGLKATWPVWLDVRPSTYPVFNVQRKYGRRDPATGKLVCTWPKDQTADFDPWGNKFVGQGQPGNGTGTGYTFPARGQPFGRAGPFQGGTLIGLGGHVHPGGLTVQADLQRGPQRSRIFTSEARYWDWKNPSRQGGPPTSWDL